MSGKQVRKPDAPKGADEKPDAPKGAGKAKSQEQAPEAVPRQQEDKPAEAPARPARGRAPRAAVKVAVKVEKPEAKPLVTSQVTRYHKRRVHAAVASRFTEAFAPTHLEEIPGKHLHPWSHACRAEALIHLFVEACRCAEEDKAETVDILSIYGSDAEHSLAAQINARMGNRGPLIRLTTYCEYTFQGDAVRHYKHALNKQGFKNLMIERENKPFHGVHMVDIYQCGDDPNRALDEDYLKSVLKLSHSKTVHVLLRSFFGQAGCDEPSPVGQEGVWYRDPHDRIVFYPEGDRVSTPYAPHPDCNWLVEGRHRKGLALTVSRAFGPYHMVRVAAESEDAIELLTPVSYPRGEFQIFTPKITCLQEGVASTTAVQKVLDKADRALPQNVRLALKAMKPVVAHEATVKMLVGSNQLVLNGFSMKGLRDKVVRAFDSDPKVGALRRTLPCSVYQDLVEGTILAVTYHGRKEFAEMLLGGRLADSETQEAFVKAFSAAPGATCFITKKQVLVGVAGVTFVALTGSWFYLFAHAAVAHGLHFTMLAQGKYAPQARSLKSLAVAGVVGTTLIWKRGRRMLAEKFSSSRSHYDGYCEVLASGGEEAPCVKTYIELLAESPPFLVPLAVTDTLPCSAVARSSIATPHGRMELTQDRRVITFEDAVNLVDCEPKGTFHPTLAFACGLAPPSNVSGVALHALAARALPDLPPVDFKSVTKHASKVAQLVVDFVKPLGAGELLTLDECADLMPTRAANRFRSTMRAISDGQVDEHMYTKKKTMLKLNETIKIGTAVKARLLDCLDPAHTVVTMQAARGVLTALKRAFSVDHGYVAVGEHVIHIIVCSGASPAYMDAVGDAVQTAYYPTILVAGDDCTIFWGMRELDTGYAATEVDGEKFDITQSIELLEQTTKVFRAVMRDCDIDPSVFEYFLKVATKPLVWTDRKGFVFKAFPRSRAPTGTTFTTAMNCVATIFWALHHFLRVPATAFGPLLADVATSGSELGFRLTVEHHRDVSQAIFLKGCFLESGKDFSFKFCSLPSQVLKLGKTIQKPTISQRERDPKKALAMAVGAMGRSMPHVQDDLPILGPFLSVLRRHGDVDERGVVEELNDNPYKVVGSNAVSRETYMAFVCQRYDTTVAAVEELEGMFAAINQLPVLISHPLVAQMSLRDYY